MKLITKNSIIFLLVTLVVFCIGSYLFYIQLSEIIHEEAEEEVTQLKDDVEAFIEKNGRFPSSVNPLNILMFDSADVTEHERLIDTTLYVKEFGETLPFKVFIFSVPMNGKYHTAMVGKEMMESDDLIETIVRSFIILALVLVVVLIAVNFLYSRYIWKPFFKTLDQLSNYDIEKHGAITYEKSRTKEFDGFSKAVSKMTAKLKADYQNLRSFTENASHELQTPIAVMIAQTEDLLQSEAVAKNEREKIYQLNQAAVRLKKLNQTLLLLSKIENDQFKVIRETAVTERLKLKLDQFEELIKMKDVRLSIQTMDKVEQTIDPVLVDAIISNLLGNALKYTPHKGQIIVSLDKRTFSVSNSGEPLNVEGERLFERFFKLNPDSDSSGLGLALVKQIASTHGHRVSYAYKQNLHIFEYSF
jgi:signal transduction histidine kinase